MQIAEALLLSEEVLRKHIQDYQNSKKLKPENGGSKEKLSRKQSERLVQHLQTHTYLYTKDIAAYVESTFKISYSVSDMCDWLKRNQFSYKKPSLVPGKANKEAQEAWISQYFKQKESLGRVENGLGCVLLNPKLRLVGHKRQ